MTVAVERTRAQSNTMPGWGIFADLMPPELLLSRQLKGLRRMLVLGLLVVVLGCVAGYVYAMGQHSSAASAVTRAEEQTSALLGQQGSYADVTKLRDATSGIQTQVATAMADDVDVAKLIGQLRAALPATMSITSLSVTVNSDGAAGTAAAGTPGLSTTSNTQIGTVTITGSGQTLNDLSTYVQNLAALPGVINVVPNSNAAADHGTAFNLTLGVTDALYTHQYDAVTTGGK